MLRAPRPVALMAVAAVVTAVAVLGGLLAAAPIASPRQLGSDARLASSQASSKASSLASTQASMRAAVAMVTGRTDQVTRSAQRDLARAQASHARAQRPPRFKLAARGKPLTLKPVPQPGDPFTFQIGSLNVLGSQHTRGSRRFAPGPVRTARAAGMFLSRGVDLLGLQEVQDDQLNVLYGRLPGYGIWPGRALGNNGVRLQIAYNEALFELVDTGYITTRFDYQSRPIPYVLLRNRATGGEFWVVNIHNSPRGQEGDRDSATAAEIALFNRLKATGRPVLVTGDMNEKEEWFCRVAVGAGMVAANGGSGSGGCSLPPGPLRIDWIMGGGGVSFSGYVQDGASLAGITDHWFVRATVTVTPTEMVVPKGS